MEQRVYRGNIDPNALADFLVQTFNQNYNYSGMYDRYTTMAQKAGQGNSLLVQIARARTWSGRIRNALGVSITRVEDGLSVSTGQTNWLDLNDPGVTGMLIGGIFFPPLLLFPIIRGISNYTFYQDVWNAIDSYCARAGASPTSATTMHGVYCAHCGTINEEGATQCQTCGAPLYAAQPVPAGQAQSQPSSAATEAGPAAETVTCPRCGSRVPAANFCSNCATPLRPATAQA